MMMTSPFGELFSRTGLHSLYLGQNKISQGKREKVICLEI
jgi:hypothetical protein